jgi:hypothetical protein
MKGSWGAGAFLQAAERQVRRARARLYSGEAALPKAPGEAMPRFQGNGTFAFSMTQPILKPAVISTVQAC